MDIKKMTGLNLETQESLGSLVQKLCYFGASGSKEYLNEFFEFLALFALAELPSRVSYSSDAVRAKLKELMKIDLDYPQVLDALNRLVEKKTIYGRDLENEHLATFGMTLDARMDLSQQLDGQISFESKIIDNWLVEIKKRHVITDEQADFLIKDLKTFSFHLYSYHSIESVSLFFYENKSVSAFLERVDIEKLTDILPPRDPITHGIRVIELPKFFKDAGIERQKYIGQQLNQIFMLQMLQVDPSGAKLLESEFSGGTLLLDTNFLIKLVGLDGEALAKTCEKIIEISRRLGYESYVTPRTLDEYEFKINEIINYSVSLPAIPSIVAEAALSATAERNYATELWRRSSEGRTYVSRKAYLEIYRNIQAFLDKLGVGIFSEFDHEVRQDQKAIANEMTLLRQSLGWVGGNDHVIEHDAHHRLLVLRLRAGHEAKSPIQMPYWLLTFDTKLPVYDRRVRKRNNLKSPYCMLASNWLQLISPFAATRGMDTNLAQSLDSPLFRLFRTPPPDLIENVIARMAQAKDFPPELMVKIISDQAFLDNFEEAKSDKEKTELLTDIALDKVIELLKEEREKDVEEKTVLGRELESVKQELEKQKVNTQNPGKMNASASASQREKIYQVVILWLVTLFGIYMITLLKLSGDIAWIWVPILTAALALTQFILLRESKKFNFLFKVLLVIANVGFLLISALMPFGLAHTGEITLVVTSLQTLVTAYGIGRPSSVTKMDYKKS